MKKPIKPKKSKLQKRRPNPAFVGIPASDLLGILRGVSSLLPSLGRTPSGPVRIYPCHGCRHQYQIFPGVAVPRFCVYCGRPVQELGSGVIEAEFVDATEPPKIEGPKDGK